MPQSEPQLNRYIAAGFLIVLIAVLVGGGVALYRNGAFSGNADSQPVNQAVENTNNNVINTNLRNNLEYLNQSIPLSFEYLRGYYTNNILLPLTASASNI